MCVSVYMYVVSMSHYVHVIWQRTNKCNNSPILYICIGVTVNLFCCILGFVFGVFVGCHMMGYYNLTATLNPVQSSHGPKATELQVSNESNRNHHLEIYQYYAIRTTKMNWESVTICLIFGMLVVKF